MSRKYPEPKMKKGDKVKLFNCVEAQLWPDVVFECTSPPWQLGHGAWVIQLTAPEKYYSSFSCECLKIVEVVED